jgi:DNA end-binding protein Ku
MAARATWKGFLKLSLVTVPVKAFTSSASSTEIRMNQLHAECHNRIRYKKVCPDHGEVGNDQIVSGYEYSKDQYVIIEPEELAKIRKQSDKSINIDGFIDARKLDPIYHSGRTYYLLPDGPVGQKPYSLLLQSMRKNKVNAFVQIVMSGKEQLALLRPLEGMLVMSMLYHQNNIKPAAGFQDELESQDLSDEELKLTDTLISATTVKSFDFSNYRDRYTDTLTELIQMKINGQEVVQAPNPDEPKIINLMEALKRSVEQAQTEAPPPRVTRSTGAGKRMAPSVRTKKPAAKRKSG